jgi:hypothetical protein
MSTSYAASLIADERSTDLQRRAERARLAVVVRCCRPRAWARTAGRAAAALARWRSERFPGTPCCGTA